MTLQEYIQERYQKLANLPRSARVALNLDNLGPTDRMMLELLWANQYYRDELGRLSRQLADMQEQVAAAHKRIPR